MKKHPYHLVDLSPWPIVPPIIAWLLNLNVAGVMYRYGYGYTGTELILFFRIAVVVYSMFVWWRNAIRESPFQGHHTKALQRGLRYGMILFIVSEIMFFVVFFWAFFHSSLPSTVEFLSIDVDGKYILWSLFSSFFISVSFLAKFIGWKNVKTKQSIIVELKKKNGCCGFSNWIKTRKDC